MRLLLFHVGKGGGTVPTQVSTEESMEQPLRMDRE